MDDNLHIHLFWRHAEGPLSDDVAAYVWRQFRKQKVTKFIFATNLRDSCYALKDSKICLIKNIVQVEENTFFIIQAFTTVAHIYEVGIISDSIRVYHCKNSPNILQEINSNDVWIN